MKNAANIHHHQSALHTDSLYCALLVPGLTDVGIAELKTITSIKILEKDEKRAEVFFHAVLDFKKVAELRCVVDVFKVLSFPVRKPDGLRSYEHMGRFSECLKQMAMHAGACSFRLEGAGSHSPAMRRLGESLSRNTGLTYTAKDREDGDLLVRLFPAKNEWRVMLRIGVRPLGVREYRRLNYPGALNGVAAASLLRKIGIERSKSFVDLCCGSGTFLAEFKILQRMNTDYVVGVDLSSDAIRKAKVNVKQFQSIDLLLADSANPPLLDSKFDTVVANLPWGERLEDRHTLRGLYEKLLLTAAKLIHKRGKILFITQHHKALQSAISSCGSELKTIERGRYGQRGFFPEYFVMQHIQGA